MFSTAEHVMSVVKAIQKSDTLLAVHLDNTPIIRKNRSLQAYIRKKLKTDGIMKKPSNRVSVKELFRGKLRTDWE